MASASEVEAKLVAHWRALPQSLAQADDGGPTNKLLLSFLSALRSVMPATSTETPGGDGAGGVDGMTASEASGGHEEVWVEGVRVLFWWVFLSDGPHACLSFLDAASRGQEKGKDVGGGGGLEQDKAALFCRLGPALLWGNIFAPEWGAILPVQEVPQALAMLCGRLRQASTVANVPAASVLLKCLGHIGSRGHAWGYAEQKELVVSTIIDMFAHSADPAIATLVIESFLPQAHTLLLHTPAWQTLSDKLRELVLDSRAAASVREAALRARASANRDDDRLLFELAKDGSAPPSLRCAALSLMTELRSYQEVFETALTLAGEQTDERVVIAATKTLCHWRVTIDLEISDVRPFMHRALCLAANAVRKEPDVPALLDLAANTVVQSYCVDAGGSLPDKLRLSLPLEVHGLLEAKQSTLLKQADPKHHKKTLRKVTKTCLMDLSEMLEYDLYDLMLPAVVSMLYSGNRWQLREGGLLVLGCLLKHRGDHKFGDGETMLSLVMPAMSDPKAKVRKMACWVVGFYLHEPCDAVAEASKLLVRLAVDDPNRGVRRKAFVALENNWTWHAKAVLKECCGILQRDHPLEEAATIAALGIIARGLRFVTLWAEAHPSADHGLYLDVVQACTQTLLDNLPILSRDATAEIKVLSSIRRASDISQFAASIDGEHKLGCLERHFGALLARSQNCEEVNECMLAFQQHKLHQPTAKFGHETAARIVEVAATHMTKRAEHVRLALWALTCISEDYPDLMDPIISALVALSAALPTHLPTTSVQFFHCLDRLIATGGVALMRPHVRKLSSALVANTTRRSPFDMGLRCCLLLVPCGVSDIDDRVLFHMIEACPLRTISDTSQKVTLRVSTESLASLVVELFAERTLHECDDPKVASAVLALLADRLQRDTSKRTQPPAAVRERVDQALSVLAAKIGHATLQADQKKWRKLRRGLHWYLPAASPLLALLLGEP